MKLLATACAAALLLLAAGCLPPGPPASTQYLVYGDSLTQQSAPYLAQRGSLVGRYFGGTAPCNWTPDLGIDAQKFAPRQVLLQFVGNLPACMLGRDPVLGYVQDLTGIANFWRARGVTVVMVISPLTEKGDLVWAQTAEREVAAVLGLPVRDAGQAVLANGAFTFFLPCGPLDTACGQEMPGQTRVRDPDGVHFAPDGARRFGYAEAG